MLDISKLGIEANGNKPSLGSEPLSSADAVKAAIFNGVATGLPDDAVLRMARGELSAFEKALGENFSKGIGRQLKGLDGAIMGLGSGAIHKHLEQEQKSLHNVLGESFGDYFKSRDHMRDMFGQQSRADEVRKLIDGASIKDAFSHIAQMDALSEELSGNRFEHTFPVMPDIPPNPIYETNAHLADLGNKIDALVDLQAKQAEVIDKLLHAQIANEIAQERTDKRSHRLNVMNMVLASLLSMIAIAVAIMFAG